MVLSSSVVRRCAMSLALVAGAAIAVAAMARPAQQTASDQPAAQQPNGGGGGRENAAGVGPGGIGGVLVKAMKSSPGCLGADAAQLASGKFAIFGFFKDKAAAMEWYNHPMHARMRQMAGGAVPQPAEGEAKREPMADVPDGVPVMAVATLVPPPPAKDGEKPASLMGSISIELYTPLTSGLSIGGAEFAPEAFRGLPKITEIKKE